MFIFKWRFRCRCRGRRCCLTPLVWHQQTQPRRKGRRHRLRIWSGNYHIAVLMTTWENIPNFLYFVQQCVHQSSCIVLSRHCRVIAKLCTIAQLFFLKWRFPCRCRCHCWSRQLIYERDGANDLSFYSVESKTCYRRNYTDTFSTAVSVMLHTWWHALKINSFAVGFKLCLLIFV